MLGGSLVRSELVLGELVLGELVLGELVLGDWRGNFGVPSSRGTRPFAGGRCQPVGWLPGLSSSSMPTTVPNSNTRGTAHGKWRRHDLLRGVPPGHDVGTITGA